MHPDSLQRKRACNRRYNTSERGRHMTRLRILAQTPEQHERRKAGRRQSYHNCRQRKWLRQMQLLYGMDPDSQEDIYTELDIEKNNWHPEDEVPDLVPSTDVFSI